MSIDPASRETYELFGRKLCQLVGMHEDGWWQWSSFISELSAHLAQPPVAEIDECEIEDMSTLLCSADGKDPFLMCYHTVEPGVMEPYGEQWVYYRKMAIAVLERQPQPDTSHDDKLADSIYVAGAKAGYNLGIDEDHEGLS